MGEVSGPDNGSEHDHIWWHYFITEGGLVWESPDRPPPEVFIQEGYACPACRAEVQAELGNR